MRFFDYNPATSSSFPFKRAIDNGANALAEGFLFSVAAALILGESYRTSRNQSKRRDDVDDKLDGLGILHFSGIDVFLIHFDQRARFPS